MIKLDIPRAARALRLAVRHTGFTPVATLGALLLFVSLATRGAVVAVHGGGLVMRPVMLARAFAAGAVYDVTVVLWQLLPLMVFLTVARRWGQRRWGRHLLIGGAALAVAGALFVAVAEVLFFIEFDGRFNFVAVDYLLYPTEVATNIWESYPTAWLLAGIAIAAAATVAVIRRGLDTTHSQGRRRDRVGLLVAYGALLASMTLVVSPDLAKVSDDRALNEIASNGYYAFWQALRGQGTSYDALYATRPSTTLIRRVHSLLADVRTPAEMFAPRSTLREVVGTRPARALNVVVVLEESLGAQLVGALTPSNAPSLTPHLDSLAAEGTLLTHAYSTGNRTIRALEATTSSLPPLPGVSIVRRPESVDLFTLPSLLRSRGYSTEFIYGGRALFDGMGPYMRRNGMDRVIEQRDYAGGQFTTAWGVADEAIFDKALVEMDSLHTSGRPFYTLVLTVSNHRPYTYPRGRIAADPDERRRVNVVEYADWALGRFMREARRHAFFDNTLFVVMGDHGPRVYGAAEIPLPSYEVPILFYAPGIVPANVRIGTLASSMDVPPTILGLLGGSYESKFFGRDVLGPDAHPGTAVMTHNNEVALMREGRLAVLGLQRASTVFSVDSATGDLRRVEAPIESDRALIEDAIAYYEVADELYRRGDYRFADADGVPFDPPHRASRECAVPADQRSRGDDCREPAAGTGVRRIAAVTGAEEKRCGSC